MKKLLILFAESFPYNTKEPFLESEIPLYRDYFDKVLLVTSSKKGEKPTREVESPFVEVLTDHSVSKDLLSILDALPWLLTDAVFYKELRQLLRSGLSGRKLYNLVVMALCGNHRACLAWRWLKKHPEYDHAVLYGYWLHIPAYAAMRLNAKFGNQLYTVSRAHGYDLYLERHKDNYLPFRKALCSRLSEIASVSQHGKEYLHMRFGASDKVSVRRLGAMDQGSRNPYAERTTFHIVTCSRTIPLKRLDRIVDALSQIQDRPIHWTHLGGGESQEALEQYAAQRLGSHVGVTFSRTIPNAQVYEIYKNQPFHVFVNVSETEGVPVSIMEALSFGIPVIATAVGGTPELIEEGKNGRLLPKDFCDIQLADCLKQFADMPESMYLDYRAEARKKFEQEYDAVRNYREFLEHLADKSKHFRLRGFR